MSFHKYHNLSGLLDMINYARFNEKKVSSILNKALEMNSISMEEASILLFHGKKYLDEIYLAAKSLKEKIHGKNFSFYGVTYISDFCVNTCKYCGDNIYSNRESFEMLFKDQTFSVEKMYKKKRLLTVEEFKEDVLSLLKKLPKDYELKELCILSGETPTLDVKQLMKYIKIILPFYKNTIILNIPPLDEESFGYIRKHVDNILHFRVFQETYDPIVYEREHPLYDYEHPHIKRMRNYLMNKYNGIPPKRDFVWRVNSQERALRAGFDEVGVGVLLGLNDMTGNFFEILSMIEHMRYLLSKYEIKRISVSFPRILPSLGINYRVPNPVTEDDLLLFVSVVRLAVPDAYLIITARESSDFRKKIRPVIDIEDYEARPGPGGNMTSDVDLQMEIRDRRLGKEIFEEVKNEGYNIV